MGTVCFPVSFDMSKSLVKKISVLCGANFSLGGCVNPASWLTLATGASFTQPLGEKCALQSMRLVVVTYSGTWLSQSVSVELDLGVRPRPPRRCSIYRSSAVNPFAEPLVTGELFCLRTGTRLGSFHI